MIPKTKIRAKIKVQSKRQIKARIELASALNDALTNGIPPNEVRQMIKEALVRRIMES